MNYQTYLTDTESDGKSAKKSKLWSLLVSMKFAIWILILLGVMSLVSMFVGELRDPEAMKNARGAGAALMQLFQMDDPFRSWWYRLLLGVLCLSLLTCIIERTPVIWRLWTKKPPEDASWLKSARYGIVRLITAKRDDVTAKLHGWSWRVKNNSLWIGERGRFGMWGPLFTHLGMLLLGVGALVGSFGGLTIRDGGYAGDTVAVEGADFGVRIDSFRVSYYPLQPGQFVLVNDEWVGRLEKQQSDGSWLVKHSAMDNAGGESAAVPAANIRNRFNSEMDRANIQRYASYVTVLENGQEVRKAEIIVNSPLRHKGYRFYQSSYDPDHPRFSAVYDAVRLAANDTTAKKSDTLTLKMNQESRIPGDTLTVTAGKLLPHFKFGQSGAYSESANMVNPAVELTFRGPGGFEKTAWMFLKFPSGEIGPGRFNYRLAALQGERTAEELMTIWEIKKTHGGWILWAGFIICTIGLILCFYVNHRVLYVEWNAQETRITGITRKTAHLYARQLDHILSDLETKPAA